MTPNLYISNLSSF